MIALCVLGATAVMITVALLVDVVLRVQEARRRVAQDRDRVRPLRDQRPRRIGFRKPSDRERDDSHPS